MGDDVRPWTGGTVTIDLEEIACSVKIDGKYKRPVCTRKCIQKMWEWRFWVTNYNVGGSWGYGEHQGIGIAVVEYEVDPRFGSFEGVVLPVDRSFSGRLRTPESHEVGAYALCVLPEVPRDGSGLRLIYNHGRTLAMAGSGADWDLALDPLMPVGEPQMDTPDGGTFVIGPVPYRDWSDPQSEKMQLVEATRACMAEIHDGYCDSVCGNCSYVLPEVSIGEKFSEVIGQDTQFENYEGSPTRTIRYVRTGKEKPPPVVPEILPPEPRDWAADPQDPASVGFRDPFTHCVPEDGRQALATILSNLGGEQRVITGLYGHNSNTDAEAEFRAFRQCATGPRRRDVVPSVCSVCGAYDPRRVEQWPCVSPTSTSNRAASTWERTGFWWHNVDDGRLGNHSSGTNPVPICRPTGKPVYGM